MLIHVGLHKTGSSWLQSRVFQGDSSGFFDVGQAFGRDSINAWFVRTDPRRRTSEYAHVPAELRAALDGALDRGLVPVLSHERLSGYPASGYFDREVIARRLAYAFPGARLLVVVREQSSLIESVYGQYIADGGDMRLSSFVGGSRGRLGRMPSFDVRAYDYWAMVRMYREVFGDGNVLVVAQEALLADPSSALHPVFAAVGIDGAHRHYSGDRVNRRRPVSMRATRRLVNRLLTRNELSPRGLIHVPGVHSAFNRSRPAFSALTPELVDGYWRRRDARIVSSAVSGNFGESNALLSEAFGLDLGAYGYELAKPLEVGLR